MATLSVDAALAALSAAQAALEGSGIVGERLRGVAGRSIGGAAAVPNSLVASGLEELRESALLLVLAVRACIAMWPVLRLPHSA